MTEKVTLEEIREAHALLDGIAIRTPMEGSRWLSTATGGSVRLKCENLQRTGSFKIRGAYTRMSRLSAEEKSRGVVAASAGNHAQGVALAAQLLGIKATVFMPEGAPIPKLNATRGYGAEVIFHGNFIDDALVAAAEFSQRTGAVMIHPFDHPDILRGQGTMGLEILEQAPDVRTVVIPLGGGGLLAGSAIAIKSQRPEVRVLGVQAEGAPSYRASLDSGEPIALPSMKTMADGIAVAKPGLVPFTAIQEYVDEVVTVSEESISRAMLLLLERAKLVVEPAGAVGVAAVMDSPHLFDTPAVVCLSGGNIDPLLMGKAIAHGMASAGRYLQLAVTTSDLPGGLAGLLGEVAALGTNVLEVAHERISPHLHLNEVEVRLQLETRGRDHAERVVERLREIGYKVAVDD